MKLYPVQDRVPGLSVKDRMNVRAYRVSRCRKPRKGEWYLSGAIPAAYRARNNLTTEYELVKLVIVEVRKVEAIVKWLD